MVETGQNDTYPEALSQIRMHIWVSGTAEGPLPSKGKKEKHNKVCVRKLFKKQSILDALSLSHM